MVGVAYQLRRGLHRIDVDDKIFLVGNDEKYFLSQHIYKNVLDHLNDDLDFSKIRTTLTDIEMAEFYYGLDLLLEKKYIEPLTQEKRVENLFEAICSEIKANFPEWTTEEVSSGIYAMRSSQSSRDIILCEDFLNPDLFEVYQTSMKANREFTPIQITSKGFWLGPVLQEKQDFCWGCMVKLLLRNKPVEHYFLKNGVDARDWMLNFDVQDYNSLNIASKIFEYVQECGFNSDSIQEVSYDGEVTSHKVWKQPHCESCGDENYFQETSTKPIVLDATIKGAKESNGFRICSPLETWERHKYLISPATGVLSYIKPFDGKNHPLRPVYVGNYFLPHGYIKFQSGEISANSFGKGTTPEQSRVSALCEGVERNSYRYIGEEVEKIATWNDISSDAVHPDLLQNFSLKQLSGEHDSDDNRDRIPEQLDSLNEISWTPVWSYTQEKQKWLPTPYCYQMPNPEDSKHCLFNPNGNATGNVIEEAVLQGLLELVERDATAICRRVAGHRCRHGAEQARVGAQVRRDRRGERLRWHGRGAGERTHRRRCALFVRSYWVEGHGRAGVSDAAQRRHGHGHRHDPAGRHGLGARSRVFDGEEVAGPRSWAPTGSVWTCRAMSICICRGACISTISSPAASSWPT